MSGLSMHSGLKKIGVLLLAVVLFAGVFFYRGDLSALFFGIFDLQSSLAPHKSQESPPSPSKPPSPPLVPEKHSSGSPSWQMPFQGNSSTNASRFLNAPSAVQAAETSVSVLPPDKEPAELRDGPETDASQAGRQNKRDQETPFVLPTNQETVPSGYRMKESTDETPTMPRPLIVYGKANPASSAGNVVQGEIPEHQTPPDTAELYGWTESALTKQGGLRSLPKGEDSVVSLNVIRELAKFLADNYWPAGTHPRAGRRGISTASVKWADVKFGTYLHGFNINHDDLSLERARVLRYFFMPSMLKGLYGLYSERFWEALEQEALSQRRGPDKKSLSSAELAEMYGLYGTMARGLSEAVRAYADTPGIRSLTQAYVDAANQAEQINQHLPTHFQGDSPEKNAMFKQYQMAILQREQRREVLIAALSSKEKPQRLDNDTILYTALWLYRRNENASNDASKALADILEKCADNLDAKRNRNMTEKSLVKGRNQ
jgi:hypothetical protein